MIVGVPKEIKVHESRVAITPEGVSEFVHAGHTVIIEDNAGAASAITNEDFIAAGASIVATADDVWRTADLVLKVKEPIDVEYSKMRKGQTLFTYLHLAASKICTDALVASGTTAIAYETVEVNGTLPLLAPACSEALSQWTRALPSRCCTQTAFLNRNTFHFAKHTSMTLR